MSKYSEFGISFPKHFLVTKGASPVYYIADTSVVTDLSGGNLTRAAYFDEKVAYYERLVSQPENRTKFLHLQHLLDFHVFSFVKFFDPTKEDDDPQNFYMEREWRVYGNIAFELSDISRITLPRSYTARFNEDVPDFSGQVTESEEASEQFLPGVRPSDFASPTLTQRERAGKNIRMSREQVIAMLREHELELKQAGIVRLSVFGSTARGDRRPDSDIDLLAAFDESRRISLLDVIHVENQITDLLGQRVDLLVEGTLKPHVRDNVDREAVRAF